MEKIKNFFKDYTVTIFVFLGLFFAYKYGTDNELLDKFLFPKTGEIKESFQQFWPKMFMNMLYSFELLFPGLFAGVFVALLIGIPMGLNRRFRRAFHPIIYSVSVIPAILISPFAIHLAPSFRAASLFLVFYNTIWATLFATINGIMTIDKRYLDNAATLQITGIKRLRKIILPAAMPSIASGFITSMRSSFLVLVYAEMYGTEYGMGYFVKWNSDLGRFESVWSGFIFMVVVLVIVMQIVEKIKDRILKWTID
ncbi:MAG: ABC transporter permease subunit [Lachnospiraceae bacterium]|jgi:NitT/TauT family transport system permease protein|nr:ABC transporter permease subunit [Lachnospiraceae bacterium]